MGNLAEHGEHSLGSPGHDEVLDALKRVLDSTDFIASERNRRFLSYVVLETLAGRADRLKGYTVAVQVFGRDATFDAQTHPLVRIEAGHLRQSLERYYLTGGKSDALRISIPKGGYVPVFERVAAAAAPLPPDMAKLPNPQSAAVLRSKPHRRVLTALTAALTASLVVGAVALAINYVDERGISVQGAQAVEIGPSVLIQSFSNGDGSAAGGQFAQGLAQELAAALDRFKTLRVIAVRNAESVASGSSAIAGRSGPAFDYVVKGSVRTVEQTTRIVVQLEESSTGALLWSRVFHEPTRAGSTLDTQSDVAAQVATTLGDPYDVLFSNELRKVGSQGSAASDPHVCTLRFYSYWLNPTKAEHLTLRACHERGIGLAPSNSVLWTDLAWLYLDEHRFGYNPVDDADPPLERAVEAARRAVALQPDSARAHLAVAIVQWFRRDFRDFDRHAELALLLNPNDPTVNAELGLRFGLRGDWARSQPLIDRALARDPIRWQTYRVSYAQHAVEIGDFEKALAELRLSRVVDHPVIKVLRAAIYGHLNRIEEARTDWAAAAKEIPRLLVQPRAWIDERSPSPMLRQRVFEGLDKAGLLPACEEPAGRAGCPPAESTAQSPS